MNKLFKRLFDVVVSSLFLIILLPVFLILAFVIKLDSKGPVFFVQKRLTKNGRTFRMLKFRTMIVNAEKIGTGIFSFKDDPRITKVGRFLRSSSLDELPQLVNVFCNSLSFVGPRPAVTYSLGDYDTLNSKYKKRFSVKAGITGWAQVKGRNDISWDEKVTLDNEYIDMFKKQGVWLDIKILFMTVGRVFRKSAVYEEKKDSNVDDATAAKNEHEEVVRLAHLSDDEYLKYEKERVLR